MWRLAAFALAGSAADLGVGDVVGEQCVELGGLGGIAGGLRWRRRN
jgi:hypothetical protein